MQAGTGTINPAFLNSDPPVGKSRDFVDPASEPNYYQSTFRERRYITFLGLPAVNGQAYPFLHVRRINGTGTMPSDTSSYASESDASEAQNAFAILNFADRTYYIKSRCVIIGRSTQKRLLINEPTGFTVPAELGDLPPSQPHLSANKRKRATSTEGANKRTCAYPGGIGPYDGDESIASIDWNSTQRLDVYPPFDANGEPTYPKAMSKDHLKLTWDDHLSKWSLDVLGRNGVFLGGEWQRKDTQVLIDDGLVIDMGHVEFKFEDPGEEMASRSYMSYSGDEDGYETDEVAVAVADNEVIDLESDEHQQHLTASTEVPIKAKRARPGRPPADGVMSKRERREREKCEKLNKTYNADEVPKNKKATKATQQQLGDDQATNGDAAVPRGRAKPKGKGAAKPSSTPENHDDGESSDASGSKSKERERSPSPIRDKSEFTEEQLANPGSNYKDQLYEILREQGQPTSLKEVYHLFKEKWPHYRFRETLGWTSSIRHQCGTAEYLKKDGNKGKGRTLELDPKVNYETKAQLKEKEKKASQAAYQAHGISHAQQASYAPAQYPGYGPMPGFIPRQGVPPPQGVPAQAFRSSAPMNQHAAAGQSIPGAQSTGASNGFHPQPPAPINGSHPNMAAQRVVQQSVGRSNANQAPPPRPSQVGSSAARSSATASTPLPDNQAKIRNLKRRVFENFRNCLINLAQDDASKTRYHHLMNDAINHACKEPDNTEYTGPDPTGDLKKIVNMLWISWGSASVNPRSSNYNPTATVAMPTPVHNPGVVRNQGAQQSGAPATVNGGAAPTQASAPVGEVTGA